MKARQIAIALDVGGTKLSGAIVDAEGHILSMLKTDTPDGTADNVIAAINNQIERLIELSAEAGEVAGIGLAVAGTIDWKHGIVVQSPNLPFSELHLKDIIEARFGLTAFMDNDGNLAAWGEKYYGVAKDAQDFVGLTIGTGIGGGIVIGGCLYRGATGSAAEIGHMVIEATGPRCTCGSYGCFEEMASGRALVRLAKEKIEQNKQSIILESAKGKVENITGPMITEAAQKQDKVALEVFCEAGFWLGIGLNNIINIFNPELVVIGGGAAEAGELLLAPARDVVAERTLHPNQDVARIVLSKLGNRAGMLGAAALVFNGLSLH
ncbi:MAG: ROK family protein [Firmicutes bacterium]|nr:ROK family protein [Bacillota bacterium]